MSEKTRGQVTHVECEGTCRNSGVVERDKDGEVTRITGQFHIGDRKSGYPILCDNCGNEVNEEVYED